jgi:multidrug efflux pump subunit AcrA (membrane-fusion protein)
MKKIVLWIVVALVVAGGGYWYSQSQKKTAVALTVKVMQGEFEVLVTVNGELLAKNFENIYGPNFQTNVFPWAEYKIQDLIPEGTIVKKGDYVAEIDRSTAKNRIIDKEDQIERYAVTVESVRMDTAINLRGLRDDLFNREALLVEMRLKLESSIYEPPATIRALEFEIERAERALEQTRRIYNLRLLNSKAGMGDYERQLENFKRQLETMHEVIAQFTVRAPSDGMVIYRRERNYQKRRAGSSINPSDNVVAQLPDLSVMLSRTHVNEIDISKVKAGQRVRIGIDAFPDKKCTGVITSVANIGEQLSGSDAKVFEVIIEINESDPILRPSMTTSNQIVINTMPDATHVSFDAIYSQDSIPFVYKANHTKQIVLLGLSNDTEIIVEQGLSAGDEVFVSVPEDSENWIMVGEELLPTIRERLLEKKRAQEELERKAAEDRRNRQQRQRPAGSGQRPPAR